MEKNIYATLDLTKSLEDFKENVAKLLELTDVREWDGRIVKEREQKIRDASLILAVNAQRFEMKFPPLSPSAPKLGEPLQPPPRG
jgi:transcription antitermination factor NusG